MDVTGTLPAFTVSVILVVSLLSGPLVGAVDLSAETRSAPGDGSAEIDVVSVPEEGRFTRVGYPTRGYHVSLSPATVEVSNLSGTPLLIYKLRIPDLGYVAITTHFLGEEFTGRQTLTLESAVLNRTSLPRETYRGEFLVIKRVREVDTVLHRGNVTLRVGR